MSLKVRLKIQLNKLKDEMMKKKKQGLSHFVEIPNSYFGGYCGWRSVYGFI